MKEFCNKGDMPMKKLLVVDDNEQNLYMLEVLLKGNGFEVDTAVHDEQALEIARKNPPDLIVSDILMPVMDGFSLCAQCATPSLCPRFAHLRWGKGDFTDVGATSPKACTASCP